MARPARTPPKARTRRQSSPAAPIPHGLLPAQYEFCLHYLANGYNATAAYRASYPASTEHAARVSGCHALARPNVKAFLLERLGDRWKHLHMGADEATALVSSSARVDIRIFYDEKGDLLPVQQWPDAIVGCVKSLKDGPYGKTLTLTDPLTAQRVILELTGKLKGPGDGFDALAAAIRGDIEKHTKAQNP